MNSWLYPFDRGENRGPERRDHKGTVQEAKENQAQCLSHIWKDTPGSPCLSKSPILPALCSGWKPCTMLPKAGSKSSSWMLPCYPQDLAQERLYPGPSRVEPTAKHVKDPLEFCRIQFPRGGNQQRLPGRGVWESAQRVGHALAWTSECSKFLPSTPKAPRLGYFRLHSLQMKMKSQQNKQEQPTAQPRDLIIVLHPVLCQPSQRRQADKVPIIWKLMEWSGKSTHLWTWINTKVPIWVVRP